MKTEILLKELQKYSNFEEKDFPSFLKLFVPFKIKKGDYFYRAGEIPKYSPFIVKGCMRKFFINEEGNDQIVYFAEEGWFAGELQCMRTSSETEMYLQALEDCEVLAITMENANIGLKTYPAYREYLDIKYSLDQSRIIKEATLLKSESPEVLYQQLLKNRPSLILRVAQHHIAGYLGVTTETISRIKRKIAHK